MLIEKLDLMLSENKCIAEVFKGLNLTELESKVYVFLAKSGTSKASDISRKMELHKAQVYHVLKSLQNVGVVDVTMETPMRFTAIPFDKLLDLVIKSKKGEVRFLEDKKKELFDLWSSVRCKNLDYSSKKFVVIQGESNVYSKFLQMIEEAKNDILTISTKIAATRSDPHGRTFTDIILKKKIIIKLLTCIIEENLDLVKNLNKKLSIALYKIDFRHVNLDPDLIDFLIIKDNEELFFGITPKSKNHQDEAGLWTNSKPVIHAFKMFFEQLWDESIDIERRLLDIETGMAHEKLKMDFCKDEQYNEF